VASIPSGEIEGAEVHGDVGPRCGAECGGG